MFDTKLAFSSDGTDKPVHRGHKCIFVLKLNSVRRWMCIRASEESLSCDAAFTFCHRKLQIF